MIDPYDQNEIVQRCLDLVYGQQSTNRFTPYNLLTNNCEHFATWARNGWAVSRQVMRIGTKVAAVGAVAATALMHRPLMLASGLGVMGFHALQQVRRSNSNSANINSPD